MVHGRLKPAERDAEMTRFRDGELDVLVGTTVVEVGVDVPAATMMIIEGADRFGLAQLHQLRGRVGRGTRRVVLRARLRVDRRGRQARLKAVAETHDGFALAEKDFELRKEGDVLGLAQSGFPRLRVASLQVAEHRDLAVRARAHAEALLDADGRMEPPRPALAAELERRLAPAGRGRANRRAARDRAATVADAGRVIAGTARGDPARGARRRRRGRSATASSRRSSRSSSPTCAAPASWTCSPVAARPASRPCRAAPPTRRSSSVTHGAAAVIAANLGRTRLAGQRARIVRAEALGWLRRPEAAAAGPFDVVIVDPPYADTGAAGRRARARSGRTSRRAAGSWPSTSGATRRRPASGC